MISAYFPIPPVPLRRCPESCIGANVVSGVPFDILSRPVRIYMPSKPATQSGKWNGRHWAIDWDVFQRKHRWENPLMGWQSSADFMQGTHLFFKTKEDAIQFTEKQGIPDSK
jgi:NADH dehydrogenase (ubiquinone) Fe-S protein 4